MWNNITPADFEEAREELQLRCEETLRKHAEEISVLDAEQADVESLDRMVTEFAEKFKIAATSVISTRNVERPRAKLSDAPMRVKMRSVKGRRAWLAGTNEPICAIKTISAACRK